MSDGERCGFHVGDTVEAIDGNLGRFPGVIRAIHYVVGHREIPTLECIVSGDRIEHRVADEDFDDYYSGGPFDG